jgi:hypothetical protein
VVTPGGDTMRSRLRWFLLLCGGVLGLLSCAPLPAQPGEGDPYALLVFPESIRLVALDSHPIDPRVRIKAIRVPPGLRRLRLVYTGTSPQHIGQQGDPKCLDVHAGHQYLFDTRTRGIIWRPLVETHTLIPGYCTTHQCTDVETHVGPPLPVTLSCRQE